MTLIDQLLSLNFSQTDKMFLQTHRLWIIAPLSMILIIILNK